MSYHLASLERWNLEPTKEWERRPLPLLPLPVVSPARRASDEAWEEAFCPHLLPARSVTFPSLLDPQGHDTCHTDLCCLVRVAVEVKYH